MLLGAPGLTTRNKDAIRVMFNSVLKVHLLRNSGDPSENFWTDREPKS